MTQMIEKKQVVIIGAGLTGLTLGFYLKKKGIDYVLLEKNERPGGVIHTGYEKGFTYELGPNTGVLGNLEIMQLFEDIAPLCELEVANPEAKRRLIWKEGQWHSLPGSLKQGITTPLFSLKDKIRILGEPFRAKGRNPMESLADMVKRRMGRSFLDYAVDPFVSGIYAGNPDLLITRFALPKLYRLEQDYGSFIGGSIKKNLKEKGPKPSREVFSVKGGLGCLVESLAKSSGTERIILGIEQIVSSLSGNGYTIQSRIGEIKRQFEAPILVSTIGAHGLDNLFPFIPKENLKKITCLEYARVVQVVLGFRKWEGGDINAFGGLVPSKEGRKILGVLFTSSFLSGRAPSGGALLNVFMGGARRPEYFDLSEKEILTIIEEEIGEMMSLPSFNPDLIKIYRYRHAIPQYTADSVERIRAIQEIHESFRGLILAGNIHEGIGMADRVAQASHVAEQLRKMLKD